jgi:tetratricopeptide (TPR) repeat protein
MVAKGLSEPVEVYEVTGIGPLRTRLQRAAARGLTRFVGRPHEMEALRHAAELARTGRGQLVAAVGEPGAGKSRLFHEFKLVSQSEWMTLEALSLSHGKATAYLPLLELLRDYLRIVPTDDARTRREKLTGKVLLLDRNLEDSLPYLFALLGLSESDDQLAQMDPQVRRRRTHEAIKRILLRESLNQPLMVIIEDLHWLDVETQALLNLLVDSIANARILLLANYRPEYRHEWGSRTYYTQLRLDPLGRESAEQMLDYLLSEHQGLAALKRLIIERTEGNPFFMEETVQALLDEGALARNGDIKLTKPLGDLKIPVTVQAMLSARVDRLPPIEKELLQTLAVIGKELALERIKGVTGKGEQQLEPMLVNLQLGEFIYEQPSIAGLEYTFKHALTQEVAYNSLLAERRRIIHEQTARTIERLHASKLEDHWSELTHHYLRGTDAAKAVQYAQLAAEQAINRTAYGEAAGMIEASLKLLDHLAGEPARLSAELMLRSIENRIAFALYGPASQQRERAINRMCVLGESIGGKEQAAGLLTRCNLYFQHGEARQGIALVDRCLNLVEATRDPDLLADAHFMAGLLRISAGKIREAVYHYENAKRSDRTGRAAPSSASILSPNPLGIPNEILIPHLLAQPLQLLGHVGEAVKLAEQSLKRARESKRLHGLAFVLAVMADNFRCLRREPEIALAEAEEGIAISDENGFPFWLHRGRFARGWALSELGQVEKGIAEMERGVAGFRQIGQVPFLPFSMARLGYAYARTGAKEEGLTMLNEALENIERTGEQMPQAEILRLKGEILLMNDSSLATDAEQCFRKSLELAAQQEARWWELRTSVSLARLLRDTNRRNDARTILGEIYGGFIEGFDLPDLKDAKALLDQLSK